MKPTPLKLAGLTVIAMALTTGTALAGNGKDCKHKKAATKTEATSMTKTDVLSTSATAPKAKMYKTYSVEDATKLCTEKGAKDLEACVAYKTGKMKKAHTPKT